MSVVHLARVHPGPQGPAGALRLPRYPAAMRVLLAAALVSACGAADPLEPPASDDVVEAPTSDACGWHVDHVVTVPAGVPYVCVNDRAFTIRRPDRPQCVHEDRNGCFTSSGCHGLGQLVAGETLEVWAAPYAESIGQENVLRWEYCNP